MNSFVNNTDNNMEYFRIDDQRDSSRELELEKRLMTNYNEVMNFINANSLDITSLEKIQKDEIFYEINYDSMAYSEKTKDNNSFIWKKDNILFMTPTGEKLNTEQLKTLNDIARESVISRGGGGKRSRTRKSRRSKNPKRKGSRKSRKH